MDGGGLGHGSDGSVLAGLLPVPGGLPARQGSVPPAAPLGRAGEGWDSASSPQPPSPDTIPVEKMSGKIPRVGSSGLKYTRTPLGGGPVLCKGAWGSTGSSGGCCVVPVVIPG